MVCYTFLCVFFSINMDINVSRMRSLLCRNFCQNICGRFYDNTPFDKILQMHFFFKIFSG